MDKNVLGTSQEFAGVLGEKMVNRNNESLLEGQQF
jgi:hypothetical protein